jgi:hypothetical protein
MSKAIKGLQSIRSMQHVNKSGIPNKEESEYIKLYLFEKERNRLKSEEITILLRLEIIQSRLKEIQNYKEKQAETMVSPEMNGKGEKATKDGENNWETMSINY